MANLIGANGQRVQTDDPVQIQEFINRGYTGQAEVLAANPGQSIQDIASARGETWNAPGGQGNPNPTSNGVMVPMYSPPTYSGPSTTDISTALSPNFTNLQTGQAGIMSGVEGLATGQGQLQAGQGTILANQGVLQGDVQNVGGQVGGVQSTIGTPSTGQTVLGDLSGLKSGQSGIMGSVAGVNDALGDFQGQFTNYSKEAEGQRDTIQKQGLSQRDNILRSVQDISPAINQLRQPIPAYNPNAPYVPGSGIMTPTAISGITSGLEATANNITNTNTQIGPQGPMYVDPRNF